MVLQGWSLLASASIEYIEEVGCRFAVSSVIELPQAFLFRFRHPDNLNTDETLFMCSCIARTVSTGKDEGWSARALKEEIGEARRTEQ